MVLQVGKGTAGNLTRGKMGGEEIGEGKPSLLPGQSTL